MKVRGLIAMSENDDRQLNTRAAALILGVEKATLDQWRLRSCGPPFIRVSDRCIRYALSDLRAFLAARRIVPAGAGAELTT